MVVDNNNNIPDSSDYHALLEYYLESFLNFEEKATRILKWNDFEKKEELQW
jgi:hypothetical protein